MSSSANSMVALPQSSLHEAACSISADAQASSSDRSSLVHVSGALLAQAQQTPCLTPSAIEALRHTHLSDGGHRLQYSSQLLGQGGYAQVFSGQEVVALSIPELVDRLTQLVITSVNTHKSFALVRPWFSLAQTLLVDRTRLLKLPYQLLTSISEDVRRRAFRAVQQLGLTGIVPDALWHVRPCAVKVLSQTSCARGAYGSRSAENEVLVTLHVTAACADCPYVGKALGFELADSVPDSAHTITLPLQQQPPGDAHALLLALEPYTVDPHAIIASRRPRRRSSSGSSTSSNCTSPDSDVSASRKRTRDAAACDDACSAVVPAPCRVAMNLWEYLVWLRAHGMQLAVAEMRALALQLAHALHSLHNDAHVMHLDVKPQNALLTDDLTLRLVDYGFAAAFKPDQPFIRVHRSGRGTPLYTAPEMLNDVPRLITPAADVYSFGCCLLTICASSFLAEPCNDILGPARHTAGGASIMGDIAGGVQLPHEVPPPFRDLIAVQRCLRHRPSRRPTTDTIIADLESIPDTLPLPPPHLHLSSRSHLPRLHMQTAAAAQGAGPLQALCAQRIELPNLHAAVPPALPAIAPGEPSAVLLSPNTSPIPPQIDGDASAPCVSGVSDATAARLALSGVNSAHPSTFSSGPVSSGAHGNHVAPEQLGTTPDLGDLSVEKKSTQNMRYTKSLRQGLAAVALAPSSCGSLSSLCWYALDGSRSASRASSASMSAQ